VKYFVLPNAGDYFFPPLETLGEYNGNSDTVNHVAVTFYGYHTNKTYGRHEFVYLLVIDPWRYAFSFLNLLFLILVIFYYVKHKYKKEGRLFNAFLKSLILFFLINFCFIIVLAPSVFRYHLFIITLIFPVLLYLLQQFFRPVETGQKGFA